MVHALMTQDPEPACSELSSCMLLSLPNSTTMSMRLRHHEKEGDWLDPGTLNLPLTLQSAAAARLPQHMSN